jgi:hypothetical protein
MGIVGLGKGAKGQNGSRGGITIFTNNITHLNERGVGVPIMMHVPIILGRQTRQGFKLDPCDSLVPVGGVSTS